MLLLIEEDQARWTYPQTSVIPRIRARWDLAVCREARGDRDGALAYLETFLKNWHEPDKDFQEIQDALDLYRDLTGEEWK